MKNLIYVIVLGVMLSLFSCGGEVTYADKDAMIEAAVKATVKISAAEVESLISNETDFILIDVRASDKFDKGYIPNAINIPRGVLEFRIAKKSFWEDQGYDIPAKDANIVVCCKLGHRGALSAHTLKQLGYTNVKNLDGGFKAWEKAYPDNVDKNVMDDDDAEGGAPEEDGGC